MANVDEYLGFMSKMEVDPGFGKFFNSHIYQWFNSYLKTEESLSNDASVIKYHGYVYVDTDNYVFAEEFYFSLKSLFLSFGFEFLDDGAQVKGSWIRKKISFFFRKIAEFLEPEEALAKIKQALELKHIDKVQSEINKNNIEAAAAFIKANENIDNAVAKMGQILFLKTTVDGKSSTITKQLSIQQMKHLEEHPESLSIPGNIMNTLSMIPHLPTADEASKSETEIN